MMVIGRTPEWAEIAERAEIIFQILSAPLVISASPDSLHHFFGANVKP